MQKKTRVVAVKQYQFRWIGLDWIWVEVSGSCALDGSRVGLTLTTDCSGYDTGTVHTCTCIGLCGNDWDWIAVIVSCVKGQGWNVCKYRTKTYSYSLLEFLEVIIISYQSIIFFISFVGLIYSSYVYS